MKAYINSIFFTLVVSTFLFSENKFLEEDKRKNFQILKNRSGKTSKSFLHTNALPDTQTIFFDDLESGVSNWDAQGTWKVTTEKSNSATHSFHHSMEGPAQDTLTSPEINLPNIDNELETLHFSFAVWAEMLDAADNSGSLLKYYRLLIKDMDKSIRGYSNEWMKYLDSPDIDVVGDDYKLKFKLLYRLESKDGLPYDDDGCTVDGWDAGNVQISNDGGISWLPLEGTPPYGCQSCFGFRHNLNKCDEPGWTDAIDDWVDAEFDLSGFAGDTIRVRFAFASDPGWSTIDDPTLYRSGYFVDEVLISNSSDTLLYDNADDKIELQPVGGSHWNANEFNGFEGSKSWWAGSELSAPSYVITYDYGEDDRPGTYGWEIYGPGSPFNELTNTELDLSQWAGKRIRLAWEFRTDSSSTSQNGKGLYIDDLKVWKKTLAEIAPIPTGLSAVTGGGAVELNWDEVPSGDIDGEISYDDGSFEDAIYMTSGAGVCGTIFKMPFGSSATATKVRLNGSETVSSISIYGYEVIGGEPADEPIYDTTMSREAGIWNEIDLEWNFEGDFLIAQEIDSIIHVPLDTNAIPSSQSWSKLGGGSWETWRSIASNNNLPDGEWGIRIEVTTTGGQDAEYNVYRHGPSEDFIETLPNAQYLTETTFIDSLVQVSVDYTYAVTSVFNSGSSDEVESSFSSTISVRPRSDTVREVAYDDGTSETGVTSLGDNSWYAVRFGSNIYPITLVALKYHARSDGGLTYVTVFDDKGENGLPGNQIGATLIFPTVTQGWNVKNVSGAGLSILDGDFYVAWGETEASPPLSIDTDSNARGHSYYFTETDAWGLISDLGYEGDLLIRTAIDIESADIIEDVTLPKKFSLSQNMPNPFNPQTHINFDVATEGRVVIRLFDIAGREIRILHDQYILPGKYTYFLDGRNLASGVYFYRMEAQGFTATKKLLLVR